MDVAIGGETYVAAELMDVATRFQKMQKSRSFELKTEGFALQKFGYSLSQLCQTFWTSSSSSMMSSSFSI